MTHDVRRHIRLFRVKVDFEKMIIHAQTLCILDDFAPTDEDPDNFSVTNVKLARLSFLEIIASGPESKSRPQTQPFLLAGFSRLADDFQAGGEQLTVLSRWQIEAGKSKLHSNFGSQSQKNQSASSALLVRVKQTRRQEANADPASGRVHTESIARSTGLKNPAWDTAIKRQHGPCIHIQRRNCRVSGSKHNGNSPLGSE